MQQWGCCFLKLQLSLSLCYLHQLFSSLALHAPMSEEETWCSALCIPQPSSNWIAVLVSVLQGGIIIIKTREAYRKEKWRERISGHSQSAEEKITGIFRNRESFEAGKDCTEWEGWWAWVPQKQQQQGLHKKKNVQPSPHVFQPFCKPVRLLSHLHSTSLHRYNYSGIIALSNFQHLSLSIQSKSSI